MSQALTSFLNLVRSAQIVDLSVMTGNRWPCHPYESQQFQQFVMNNFDWPRGPYLEHVQIHDDHTGTHFDAPCHQVPSPESGLVSEYAHVTVDMVPPAQMMGAACVIDVRSLRDGYPAGERTHLRESPVIERVLIEQWEEEHGQLQPGDIALFRTGWSDDYYRPYPEGWGYDRSHPAASKEAIDLLFERGVRCMGVDCRGLGLMQDDYTPHWAALGRNIVGIENLTNLGSLPTRGGYFVFLSHKFEGASGGMGRAIGIVFNES